MSHSFRLVHPLRGVALASVAWVLLSTLVSAQDQAPANRPSVSTEPAGTGAEQAAQERASEHFDRGVALYRHGDFEGALVEFRRAYEAVPTSGLLFNLGQTAAKLHDYAQAKTFFERYLQGSEEAVSAERRELVTAELKQLRSRIGYAQLSVSVSGAEVWVDQRSVGRTPLSEPLTLNVGRHRVEVRADGYQAEVQTLELAGGEERALEFRLQPLSVERGSSPVQALAPVQAQAAESPKTAKRAWLRPARIASLSMLGVGAVGAVAAGVLASKAHDELTAELASRPGDRSAIQDARVRTRSYSIASDASLGVAAVSAVLSVTFLWMERSDRRAVSLAIEPRGVAIRGVF